MTSSLLVRRKFSKGKSIRGVEWSAGMGQVEKYVFSSSVLGEWGTLYDFPGASAENEFGAFLASQNTSG